VAEVIRKSLAAGVALASLAIPTLHPGSVLGAQEPGSGYLSVEDHPEREEIVLSLGPIDLPARTPHHGISQIPVQQGVIPFDMTVDGYRVEAVDRRGRRVPQDVIHHLNLLDPTSRELFLPIMRRVLAASHETPPVKVPEFIFGLPLEQGDPFLLLTMLHNPTDTSYEGVTVRLVLNYNRSNVTPMYRLYAFHLDVMFPLGSKAFDLPPGKTVKSWEGSPAVPGGIVGMGGHLHRYGRRLELEDVTEGRVLWRFEPKRSESGQVHEVPVQIRHRTRGIGVPISPDHRYRVSVTFFNPTGDTIPDGGMGSVAGGFIPYDHQDWPSADLRDPVYAEDYRNVLMSTQMPAMEHEEQATFGDDQ
jgi:hypothetical protein